MKLIIYIAIALVLSWCCNYGIRRVKEHNERQMTPQEQIDKDAPGAGERKTEVQQRIDDYHKMLEGKR